MPAVASRLAFVDALKAVASQFIVLHHLAFYGPMSDVANDLAPALFSWLSQNARLAVQVFLVIGGFLAAQGAGAERPPAGRGAARAGDQTLSQADHSLRRGSTPEHPVRSPLRAA